MKNFFALPMEKKLMVKAINFAFGYVGGSPVSWRYKWWLEGLHMKVSVKLSDDECHFGFNTRRYPKLTVPFLIARSTLSMM